MAIKQIGQKKWRVIISTGLDPVTGRYKQKWFTVTGKREDAEAFEMRKKIELIEGTYVDSTDLTVAEYMRRWLDHYEKNLKPNTRYNYRQKVDDHVVATIGRIPLAKLRPIHLDTLYTQLLSSGNKRKKDTGLSAATVRYVHVILSEALEQAVKWQLVNRNPADAAEPPTPKKRVMKTLDEEKGKAFLREAQKSPLYGEPMYVAIMTAMRKGEVLGLRKQDVDLKNASAHIQVSLTHKGGIHLETVKTDSSRRRIPLPSPIIEIFRRRIIENEKNKRALGSDYQDQGLIFCHEDGLHLSPNGFYQAFKRTARRIGIPDLRLHDLRHTAASLLLQQGVHPKVVQELLGHRDIRTTLDTYSHVLPGIKEESTQKLARLLEDS